MKRTEPISIGEAFEAFFAQRRLAQGCAEGRALDLWRDVVGDYTADATEDIYIRKGVLYAHFKSPSVRADVATRKLFLISELNRQLGSRVIINIALR